MGHEVETKCRGWQSIKIEGTCGPGDSKVTTVDLMAYNYVKEKIFYLVYASVVSFSSFWAEPYPTATFQLDLD